MNWIKGALIILICSLIPLPQEALARKKVKNTPTPVPTAHPPVSPAPVKPYPFKIGERLEYNVSWLGISAGIMTLEVKENTQFAGEDAYRFSATGETSRFFSRFFKVKDKYDSFVRVSDLVSLYFLKNIREGKYRVKLKEVFDHKLGVSRYRDRIAPIPPDVRDILAGMYFLRTLPLTDDAVIPINAIGDGRNYRVDVIVHGRKEVKVPAGKISVIDLEPASTFEGRVYKAESSKLRFYFTDDERRIPVLITTKVPIGKIRAELRALPS